MDSKFDFRVQVPSPLVRGPERVSPFVHPEAGLGGRGLSRRRGELRATCGFSASASEKQNASMLVIWSPWGP